MRCASPSADTRAAAAALARLPTSQACFDRCLLIDDTDEDATAIIAVVTERTVHTHTIFPEVQS